VEEQNTHSKEKLREKERERERERDSYAMSETP